MFQFKLGRKKGGKKKKTKEGERKKTQTQDAGGLWQVSRFLKKKKKKKEARAGFPKNALSNCGTSIKASKMGTFRVGVLGRRGRNLGTSDNSEHTPPLFRGRGGRPVKKRDRSKFAQMKRSRRSPSSPALLPPFTLPLSFTPRH